GLVTCERAALCGRTADRYSAARKNRRISRALSFVRRPNLAARSHRSGRFADQRITRADQQRKIQRNNLRPWHRRRRRGDDELSCRSFKGQTSRAYAYRPWSPGGRWFGIGGRIDIAASTFRKDEAE